MSGRHWWLDDPLFIAKYSHFLEMQKRLRESWKLCLDLCSLRWLKPIFGRDRSFIPLRLWQLNVLLGDDLMNDRIRFLKTSILSEFFYILFKFIPLSYCWRKKKYSWKSRVSHLILKFYWIVLFCMTNCV